MPVGEEVLLLLARPSEMLAGDRRPVVTGLLSRADVAHVERFRAERDRDMALASRATQRLALSAFTAQSVAPGAWQFAEGGNGRPLLHEPPAPWRSLRFSAANAIGLVGCAVCIGREIGLDLEPRRQDLTRDLLDSCLSSRERQQLDAVAESDRPDRFAHLWTAKEAYLKARGLGITDSLDQVEVDFDAGPGPALRLGVALEDADGRWQLRYLQPTADHVVALCIERVNGAAGAQVSPRWVQFPAAGASAAPGE